MVVDHRNRVFQVVELRVEGFAGILCGIKRCGGFERPVPHASGYLAHGRIVIPVKESRGVAVAVAEFVVIPDLPDALVIHRSQELRLFGELLDALRGAVFVGHVGVECRHEVEAVAVGVVPDLFVDGPQVLFVHHFAQAFDRRQARGAVFGIEAVDAAAARGSLVLVVAHDVDLLVGAAVVDAAAFRLHLVAARAVEARQQPLCLRHLRALVRGDVVGQRWMVADALHRRNHVRIVDAFVVGVVGVARHPELLPYEDAQRVAKLEEIVRFGDAAAPETDEVHARLGRVAQFGVGAFVRRAEHGLRQPVRAPDEERFAVDAERARTVRRGGRGGDFPDAEARRNRVADLAVKFDFQRQVVKFLFPFVQRPPQARVADHQLRELLGGENHLFHFAAVE